LVEVFIAVLLNLGAVADAVIVADKAECDALVYNANAKIVEYLEEGVIQPGEFELLPCQRVAWGEPAEATHGTPVPELQAP